MPEYSLGRVMKGVKQESEFAASFFPRGCKSPSSVEA